MQKINAMLLAGCVLLAAFMPVQIPGGTPSVPRPPTENPFCGKTAADFPAPPMDCPDDGQTYAVDVQCHDLCADSYAQGVAAAWAAGCAQYDANVEAWQEELDQALDVAAGCISAARNPTEVALCKADYWQTVNAATQELEFTIQGIENSIEADIATALTNYEVCSLFCCIPVGDH